MFFYGSYQGNLSFQTVLNKPNLFIFFSGVITMKKANIFILITLLILCILSDACAYDSFWERVKDTEAQGELLLSGSADNGTLTEMSKTSVSNDDNNYRIEETLTVDSFEYHGTVDEKIQPLIQMLDGLVLSGSHQDGDVPMRSVRIELGGKEFFTYNCQITTPYFVSSNYLGDKTYMVYPEDQFEEKIVSAFYKTMEKVSGSNSDLPDIEQVYALIRSIRESNINTGFGTLPISNETLSFDKEPDSGAFVPVLIDFLSRFKEAEPEKQNNYFYTDFPRWSRKYTWPEINTLPSFTVPASAVAAEYTAPDLETIFDALDRFLEDNPDYAAFLNQQLQAGLAKSNPELAREEGVNSLDEMINEIRNSLLKNFKTTVVNVKKDLDENGNTVLTTIRITANDNSSVPDSGIIIKWHSTKDDVMTVTEAAVDLSEQNTIQPYFRLLSTTTHNSEENDTNTVNFIFDIQNEDHLEYAQTSSRYVASTMTRVSDSDIQFAWNKESGSGKIFTTEIPNEFGKYDSTRQISYDHVSDGNPLFSFVVTSESSMSSPLSALSPSDAVAASQMDESDYDQIASNIFMQLFMLMMSFS